MLSDKAVKSITEKLAWTDIPKVISYSLVPIPNVPSSKFGLINRVIQFSHGSWDSRTPGQWKQVNRYLMRGAESIYIVVPQLVSKQSDDGAVTKELKGFTAVQVFDMSQSYGNPVEVATPKPKVLDIKFISEQWIVSMDEMCSEYEVTSFYNAKVYTKPNEEKLFFWSVVNKVYRELFADDEDIEKRILIEEIAALSLLRLCSFTIKFAGNRHYKLIEAYGRTRKLSSLAAVFHILKRVEMVLDAVLEESLKDA